MVGFDDHTSIMGEWMTPNQSPSGDFSSMISNNVKTSSFAVSVGENNSGHLFAGDSDNRDQARSVVGDEACNSNAARQMSSRGGLVERMAARTGINVPRLDTDRIRPADLSKIPEVHSPYLTIPPGLSPTTLLDSPVFLSNLSVLPSPTTGKFSFASTGNNLYPALMTEDRGMGKRNTCVDFNASSFAFQTVAESGLSHCFNTVNKANPSCSLSPYASVDVYRDEPPKSPSQNNGTVFQQTNYPISYAEDNGLSNHSSEPTYNSADAAKHSPPLDEPHEDDGDQLSNGDTNAGGSPSEDGYNWRKYGQKQVKGSEYPRSYYKCTHPNCPVKKKVERSEEGDITEIIYKGAHNHSKLPFNRRLALGSSNPLGDVQLGSEQHGTGANDALIWSTLQKGNLDVTQSTGLSPEYGIGTNILHTQTGQVELGDGVDGSSTFSNEDDDDDDRVTHGSVSLGYDGEGDESESKRRRIETYASDVSGATRAIREPRVVVQTTSEVDILDDGYRWRKYGQKVVKGNPNPRSYYKCTSPGCNVRKHVERASHDLKSVITTYEGKHNHDVPAARNSSHVNSGSHPNQQAPIAATSSSLARRPQPTQVHAGTSPFKTLSVGSFGRPQLGPGPGPGFGFGVNQPGFASLALAGLCPNPGRLPVLPVHAYLGNQVGPMGNNLGFMMAKGEPKMEPVTDSGLNPPNASSVYQHLMSRLPLGPQM